MKMVPFGPFVAAVIFSSEGPCKVATHVGTPVAIAYRPTKPSAPGPPPGLIDPCPRLICVQGVVAVVSQPVTPVRIALAPDASRIRAQPKTVPTPVGVLPPNRF